MFENLEAGMSLAEITEVFDVTPEEVKAVLHFASESLLRHHLEKPMQSVIKIPRDLARELDLLAQAEHKRLTPYVVDLLRRHVRRNKQRQALKLSSGAWNPDHHPELARGGAAYIETIRPLC